MTRVVVSVRVVRSFSLGRQLSLRKTCIDMHVILKKEFKIIKDCSGDQ